LVHCIRCGSEAMQGATFCHNCGTRLAPTSIQQSIQDLPAQNTSHSQRDSPSTFPGVGETTWQWGPMQTVPPKKNERTNTVVTMVIVIFLIAILIGAAVSIGWVYLYKNGNATSDNHSPVFYAGNCTITYSWSYNGKLWTLNEVVSNASYYGYRDQPKTYDFASYVTKTDSIVVKIAQELKSDATKNGYNPAQFILSFVQNVPYGTDENTTGFANYPRYPVETLVDTVGDCKDHSTLYVSLMESQPVNVSMVLLQLMPNNGGVGHMAAGIWGSGYSGTYFQYDGRDYYYCETTSQGWMIGEMPTPVKGYDVTVLPV